MKKVPKDIKDKIETVSDYFKDRILNGDYDTLSADKYNLHIRVGEYEFSMWIGGHPNFLSHDIAKTKNVFNLIFSKEEAEKIWFSMSKKQSRILEAAEEAEMVTAYYKLQEEIKKRNLPVDIKDR